MRRRTIWLLQLPPWGPVELNGSHPSNRKKTTRELQLVKSSDGVRPRDLGDFGRTDNHRIAGQRVFGMGSQSHPSRQRQSRVTYEDLFGSPIVVGCSLRIWYKDRWGMRETLRNFFGSSRAGWRMRQHTLKRNQTQSDDPGPAVRQLRSMGSTRRREKVACVDQKE